MKLLKAILFLFVVVSGANAFEDNISSVQAVSTTSNTVVNSDEMNLINLAGRQRMLSQTIAKDYMYKGRGLADGKARKQLKVSIGEFSNVHNQLLSSVNDPEIKNLLEFVKMSSEDFNSIVTLPFNLDNAQLALDLSESMLEGSQYVVDSLKTNTKHKESSIVATAGKQRMLSQRIAKYYIAYQSGIKDDNTVNQMKEAVSAFQKNHNELMKNVTNTSIINQKLNKIDKLWKIVHKFYLSIEKGGLPFIVFTTTDDITKKMNEITKLYVSLYK
jgi:hypothetical protein